MLEGTAENILHSHGKVVFCRARYQAMFKDEQRNRTIKTNVPQEGDRVPFKF